MKKIKKPEYFMKVAELTALNSTCVKKSVGAVLVREGKILSTGYNGAPSGVPHCNHFSCLRRSHRDNQQTEICRGVHAEVNCIVQCAIHGTQIGENSAIYGTYFPCMSCAKQIINSKIKYIIFLNDYEMDNGEKMNILSESNIEIYRFAWTMNDDGKTEFILELFDAKKRYHEIFEKKRKTFQ